MPIPVSVFAPFVFLIIAVSVLAGCGDSDGGSQSTNDDNSVDSVANSVDLERAVWDLDAKVRRNLVAGLRSEPSATSLTELEGTDADGKNVPSRAQWFGDTLVHLRTDGVTAYESNGTERWSWAAPIKIDDLERDEALLYNNQVLFINQTEFLEEIVGLDLGTGAQTLYGETEMSSLIGVTPTGVWGTNPSGDFEAIDLTVVREPVDDRPIFIEPLWHVDTNGPVDFSERATAVAYAFDEQAPDYFNELRWYDLVTGAELHAPAPTTPQAAVALGDDEVYAASDVDDQPNELIAYDLETGEPRWSIEQTVGFGDIVAVNEDLVALRLEPYVVFDAATGDEVWREDDDLQADRGTYLFENAPGMFVAISDDSRLYARDIEAGVVAWSTPERERVSGEVFVADGTAYVVNPDSGEISAFDLESGAQQWMIEIQSEETSPDGFVITSFAVTDQALAITTTNELILLST